MKTYKELKDFAEKRGSKFKLNPKFRELNLYDFFGNLQTEKEIFGYYFGIQNPSGRKGKSEYQWVWFETYKTEVNEDTIFYFEERYSMLNGKSYKGISEEIRINEMIEKALA